MVLAAINTVLSWVPLAILFVIYDEAPRWLPSAPLFMLVEVIFAAGLTLGLAGLLIQIRDLVQVLPVFISLGLFVEPVVWPLSKIPKHILPIYCFLNPLGPVIDNVRRTMLLGLAPDWGLMGLATAGAFLYLIGGYRIFKRLGVVADTA